MIVDYKKMLVEEFCQKYVYLHFFDDINSYYQSYYQDMFIIKVVIGFLIEVDFIKEFDREIDIKQLLTYYPNQEVKIVRFDLKNNYTYLACIPKVYTFDKLQGIADTFHVLICDIEIRELAVATTTNDNITSKTIDRLYKWCKRPINITSNSNCNR